MGEKGEGGEGDKPDECLTFLYQLTEGAAGKSYGLNVARLAHIPSEILRVAATKSHQLEETITKRRLVGWLSGLFVQVCCLTLFIITHQPVC